MFVLNSTVAFVSLLYFKAEIGNHKVTSVILHACTRRACSASSPTKLLGPGWLWPSRRHPQGAWLQGGKPTRHGPRLQTIHKSKTHPVGFATVSVRWWSCRTSVGLEHVLHSAAEPGTPTAKVGLSKYVDDLTSKGKHRSFFHLFHVHPFSCLCLRLLHFSTAASFLWILTEESLSWNHRPVLFSRVVQLWAYSHGEVI